ncbi:hypothetical protein SAMN05660493_00827 [Epilithonimonas bovis DSM 19482]|jgi:hypothetical protein|uniref:Uncharacterized protein n=1 Tax=Epilithonimonas bovis DSM 19482 TaxID=1121284 RepID=A0A1U7PUH1_9FLAO|nr:hypothetical protein SAMN05660493_00827 [Epilithonimonas bovis DSM 19482]
MFLVLYIEYDFNQIIYLRIKVIFCLIFKITDYLIFVKNLKNWYKNINFADISFFI